MRHYAKRMGYIVAIELAFQLQLIDRDKPTIFTTSKCRIDTPELVWKRCMFFNGTRFIRYHYKLK